MNHNTESIVNTNSVDEFRRPAVDLDEARRFLDRLFEPGDTCEFRALRPKGAAGLNPSCYAPMPLESPLVENWIASHHRPTFSGLYFCPAVRKPRTATGSGRTGKTEEVAFTRCLWADFDGLADVDPEEAAAMVLQRIEDAALPRPSIVVSSGRGCHTYWRLNEPLPADRIAAHHRAIHPLIGSDNVGDPTRPMRMVGTLNFKCDPPRPCYVIESNDVVWDIGDFPRPDKRSESTERGDADPADADEVPGLLARLAPWRADDRDSWVRIGMICKSVSRDSGVDLLPVWDSWSQQSDKYDANDAARRWRSFQPRGELGFGTLVHLANEDSPRVSAEVEGERMADAAGPAPSWMPRRDATSGDDRSAPTPPPVPTWHGPRDIEIRLVSTEAKTVTFEASNPELESPYTIDAKLSPDGLNKMRTEIAALFDIGQRSNDAKSLRKLFASEITLASVRDAARKLTEHNEAHEHDDRPRGEELVYRHVLQTWQPKFVVGDHAWCEADGQFHTLDRISRMSVSSALVDHVLTDSSDFVDSPDDERHQQIAKVKSLFATVGGNLKERVARERRSRATRSGFEARPILRGTDRAIAELQRRVDEDRKRRRGRGDRRNANDVGGKELGAGDLSAVSRLRPMERRSLERRRVVPRRSAAARGREPRRDRKRDG